MFTNVKARLQTTKNKNFDRIFIANVCMVYSPSKTQTPKQVKKEDNSLKMYRQACLSSYYDYNGTIPISKHNFINFRYYVPSYVCFIHQLKQ
ncbi:hypothetical protein Hanom_Chr09g00869811 [Helianthus anomalus]